MSENKVTPEQLAAHNAMMKDYILTKGVLLTLGLVYGTADFLINGDMVAREPLSEGPEACHETRVPLADIVKALNCYGEVVQEVKQEEKTRLRLVFGRSEQSYTDMWTATRIIEIEVPEWLNGSTKNWETEWNLLGAEWLDRRKKLW